MLHAFPADQELPWIMPKNSRAHKVQPTCDGHVAVVSGYRPSLANDHAAGRTLRPTAVAIHIHEEIADQRFVPKLVAPAKDILAPPIVATIPTRWISPFRPTLGLMDARPLLDALIGGIDWRRDGTIVRFVVIADDIQR